MQDIFLTIAGAVREAGGNHQADEAVVLVKVLVTGGEAIPFPAAAKGPEAGA